MGETADPKVVQLVSELSTSFHVFKEKAQDNEVCFEMVKVEEAQEDEVSSEMESYDKVLASLFDMGYDFELASRAILDCGRLDVAAIIEHMDPESPTSVAMDSSIMPSILHSTLPSSTKVKVEEEVQQVSSFGIELTHPRAPSFEASTSRAPLSMKDQDEWVKHEQVSICRRSLRSSEPCGTILQGKHPISAKAEDDRYGDTVDSDRWEHDDEPETDKGSLLLRMGFLQKDVTDALQACGEDSDVNQLANHIINHIVGLREPNWDDSDPVADDLVGGVYRKDVKKEDVEDSAGEELTDQGLLILNQLRRMGLSFSIKMVVEAIQACGEDAEENAVVDYLFKTDERNVRGDNNGEDLHLTKLEQLMRLGCATTAACLRAIDNNGNAEIDELLDYIYAEQHQDQVEEDEDIRDSKTPSKKRKRKENAVFPKLLQRKEKKGKNYEEDEQEEYSPKFHRNMKGFGLPGEPVIPRMLSEDISRPPYFYFENVAIAPKDEWSNIQRHLYNIAPEFVDSLNFSPCRRPRGYIHNLPVVGRVDILPKPPMTVQALTGSAGYWPAWDTRVKLNTINTRAASEFVRRQIKESMVAVEKGEQSLRDINLIMYWAKKWNLVWIKPGELAPLSPEEIETCLGFDVYHTRVLYSNLDRTRVLGNSFQVNTVAYHLSVLRPMYSNGIRVLSLFSGIGGAEVALHKLGIFLKLVVSVEIDDKARMVVDSWWKTTNQKGRLIHSFKDVREVDSRAIKSLVDEFGGFDLVIGGSPCNNLSGNNRCSRVGLAGSESVTFFEFPRILADVRDYMAQRRR